MGRKAKPYKADAFNAAINEVSENFNGGRTEFYGKVAENYGARIGDTVSTAWVQQRIAEHNITINVESQKGKHAQSAEHTARMRNGTRNRTSRASKFKANPAIVEGHKKLREKTPQNKHGLVDKIENGSLTAAVALFCYQCSGNSSTEAKNCHLDDCPLWAFRPNAATFSESLVNIENSVDSEEN